MDRASDRSVYSQSVSALAAGPGTTPLSSTAMRMRASPLHSASVHVTEFSNFVNPVPRGAGQRGEAWREDHFGGDYLSPVKLREMTGESDLAKVTYLEVSVNSQCNSLGNFGCSLPNLTELRVVESVVPCVRDLGTALSQLTILWLPQCHLLDLDGLPALTSLQELYIAFNNVSDVSLVAMLPRLEVLDIESNNLAEEDQLGYLALCSSLSSVILEGNPLASSLAEREGGEGGYRAAVLKIVPHLKVLDDIPITATTSPPSSTPLRSRSSEFALRASGMGADWEMVTRGIKEAGRLHGEGRVSPQPVRPKTAAASLSPVRSVVLSSPVEDDSSELTHGLSQVICGNPVRALKARQRYGLSSQSAAVLSSSSPSSLPPHSSQHGVKIMPPSLSSVMEEITVTKATSMENLEKQPDHFPQTSFSDTPQKRLPTPPSSHPTPPSSHPRQPTPPTSHPPPRTRPKSVADFRQRRYKRTSPVVTRSLSEQVSPPQQQQAASTYRSQQLFPTSSHLPSTPLPPHQHPTPHHTPPSSHAAHTSTHSTTT